MNDLAILKEVQDIFHRQNIISIHNSAVNGKIETDVNNKISEQINNRNRAYNIYSNKLYRKEVSLQIFLIVSFSIAILALCCLFAVLSYYLSDNRILGHILFLSLASWASIIFIFIGIFAISEGDIYNKLCIPVYVLLGILSLSTIIALIFSTINGWSDFFYSLPRFIKMFPLFGENVSFLGGVILSIFAIIVFILSPIISLFIFGKTTWWILLFIIIFAGLICGLTVVSSIEDYEKIAERSLSVQIAKQHYQEQYAIYQAAYNKTRDEIEPQYKNEFWIDDTFTILSKYWREYRLGIDMNLETVNKYIWCIENSYAYDIVSAKQWLYLQDTLYNFQQQIEQHAKEARERFDKYNADQERRHQERLAAEKEANDQLEKHLEKLNTTAEKSLEASRDAAKALNSIDDRFIRYTQ